MKTTETYSITIEKEYIPPDATPTTLKLRNHQSGLEHVWTVSYDFDDYAIGAQLGFIFKELRSRERSGR
jgi:hypothetical protein